ILDAVEQADTPRTVRSQHELRGSRLPKLSGWRLRSSAGSFHASCGGLQRRANVAHKGKRCATSPLLLEPPGLLGCLAFTAFRLRLVIHFLKEALCELLKVICHGTDVRNFTEARQVEPCISTAMQGIGRIDYFSSEGCASTSWTATSTGSPVSTSSTATMPTPIPAVTTRHSLSSPLSLKYQPRRRSIVMWRRLNSFQRLTSQRFMPGLFMLA